jgi:DinB family protein
MIHPLVLQLRFTRSEFRRSIDGVTEEEARVRFQAMNSISWNVGHLAWQEQRYWLHFAQGQMPFPEIQAAFAFRAEASTPELSTVLAAWNGITSAADPWLDEVTIKKLQEHVTINGKESPYIYGSLLQRTIYHYWFHIGQNIAIRKMLGHSNYGVYVGDIDGEAPYRPEE